jgi:hypothetical protein
MIIEFLPEANGELMDAVAYYEGELTGLGQRFWGEVDQHIAWIAQNPEVPRLRDGGYRRVNLNVFPYSAAAQTLTKQTRRIERYPITHDVVTSTRNLVRECLALPECGRCSRLLGPCGLPVGGIVVMTFSRLLRIDRSSIEARNKSSVNRLRHKGDLAKHASLNPSHA